MSTVGTIFLVLGIIAAITLPMGLQARRRRRKHLQAREPVSDEMFLAEVAAPQELRGMCLALRTALARAMGVPAQTVYASDTFDYITRFGLDGMDVIDIVFAIEKTMSVHFDRKQLDMAFAQKSPPASLSVAEFARYCAENWHHIANPPGRKPCGSLAWGIFPGIWVECRVSAHVGHPDHTRRPPLDNACLRGNNLPPLTALERAS